MHVRPTARRSSLSLRMFFTGLIAIAQMTGCQVRCYSNAFPDKERNPIESDRLRLWLEPDGECCPGPLACADAPFTRPRALWCIVLMEGSLLLLARGAEAMRRGVRPRFRLAGFSDLVRPGSFSKSLVTILAAATLLLFLDICYQNWDTVFMSVDDLANWDRWACEWAGGDFPRTTWWYPQLLPANWSAGLCSDRDR